MGGEGLPPAGWRLPAGRMRVLRAAAARLLLCAGR